MKSPFPFFFCLFLSLALLIPGTIPASGIDCMKCHKDLVKGKNVHPAVSMGCARCHTGVDARTIPHKMTNKYPKGLFWSQPGLCYGCHDSGQFIRKHLHPAMADGQCKTCHNPHSSNHASLLEMPESDLCNGCHDGKASGKHILQGYGLGDAHPAKGKPDPSRPGRELSCTSCHTPHSSTGRFLFSPSVEKDGNLCRACHTKIMVKP